MSKLNLPENVKMIKSRLRRFDIEMQQTPSKGLSLANNKIMRKTKWSITYQIRNIYQNYIHCAHYDPMQLSFESVWLGYFEAAREYLDKMGHPYQPIPWPEEPRA